MKEGLSWFLGDKSYSENPLVSQFSIITASCLSIQYPGFDFFWLLGIFLWGESQNTTFYRISREGEVSLMEKAVVWYFKSHFYASAERTWSPSISNHVGYAAGHILDLVKVLQYGSVCCNQSSTDENLIWQVWNRGRLRIPTIRHLHRIPNKSQRYKRRVHTPTQPHHTQSTLSDIVNKPYLISDVSDPDLHPPGDTDTSIVPFSSVWIVFLSFVSFVYLWPIWLDQNIFTTKANRLY